MVRVEAREEALGREFQADRTTSANPQERKSMGCTGSYGQLPQSRQLRTLRNRAGGRWGCRGGQRRKLRSMSNTGLYASSCAQWRVLSRF